jgi:glucose-6-phosphate 1-dehydrogenase
MIPDPELPEPSPWSNGHGVNPEPQVIPADPCTLVIFGASGDLTKRKLIPALYHLAMARHLNPDFAVVGFAWSDINEEEFKKRLTADVQAALAGPLSRKVWDWFLERLYYVRGDFDNPEAYGRLQGVLAQADRKHGTKGNVLFYLATLPDRVPGIVGRLAESGLSRQEEGFWRRVVFEKPFGHDLESARSLNRMIKETLDENQVYRIDHYLGKETVQNILAFRFGNTTYEPVWNQRYIDHVAITVSEELGVEQRGPYYETAGALRDMIPNHLLQLLTLTAMEPPASLDAEAIRDEKSKALKSIHILTPEEVLRETVRGQYGDGVVEGQRARAYRAEDHVARDSRMETFVALKLHVDNWRWGKTPFYLRTGKRLAKRVTQIAIQFKNPPFQLFKKVGVKTATPNTLIMGIQPVEGIEFSFLAKAPGPGFRLGKVSMDFNYCDHFGCALNTGYETLLYDCMIGDATQFQRADMSESSWALVQPILDVWKTLPPQDFPNYAAGSEGPPAADELMARDGRAWIPLG